MAIRRAAALTNTPQPLGEELWVVPASFRLLGMELGNRMTVVRYGQRLLLHSPVPFNPDLAAELDKLGRVGCLFVPNRHHTLFVRQWQQAYPGAVTVAPGSASVAAENRLENIGRDNHPPWDDSITVIPVLGVAMLDEYLVYHAPSRTLILTDLAFNIGDDYPAVSRTLFRLYGSYGRFGPSRLIRALVRDRKAFRNTLRKVLKQDIDKIVVSHGTVVESAGADRLRDAFAEFL